MQKYDNHCEIDKNRNRRSTDGTFSPSTLLDIEDAPASSHGWLSLPRNAPVNAHIHVEADQIALWTRLRGPKIDGPMVPEPPVLYRSDEPSAPASARIASETQTGPRRVA